MRARHYMLLIFLFIPFLLLPLGVDAAKNVTSFDSTQPRGFGGVDDPLHTNECPDGVYNTDDLITGDPQDLCPIEGGIWTPFYYLGNPDDGQGSQFKYFETWKGMMMGNGARDPAFFAMLSTVNRDQINLFNAAAINDGPEVRSALYKLLVDPGDTGALSPVDALNFIGLYLDCYDPETGDTYPPDSNGSCDEGDLEPVIYVDLAKAPYVLQPEDKLPVAADVCLRCHFTVDWLEGRSEPQTSHAPYLRGQFWGAEFREYPGWPGDPELLVAKEDMFTDIQAPDSEAGMEGIQCMYCHRQDDNFKRASLYDSTTIPNGIGGYFLIQQDPYFSNGQIRPTSRFQRDPFLCGTCHDVTNPLIKEQNTVLTNDAGVDTDYKHPIERTFTEWFWSSHGPGGGSGGGHCERCHKPMIFQGAQTWMLEGLDQLWGEVDRKWKEAPYYYDAYTDFSSDRHDAYYAAAQRSRDLVAHPSDSAKVDIEEAEVDKKTGEATVTVRITNNAGHKIPTGFAEGRQMWIHLKAVDETGKVIYESGIWDDIEDVKGLYRFHDRVNGELVERSESIKVYEHVSLAKNYGPFTLPDQKGCDDWNILDYTNGDPFDGSLAWEADCEVSHFDKEFHFVLLNYVEKDNRIPPKGWIPEAYAKDGAFVVENGEPDYDRYLDDRGRSLNYDDTTFTFDASQAEGDVTVTAKVMYQTFNEHFMEYLEHVDQEKMMHAGARARNAPCTDLNPRDGSDAFCGYETWGSILYDIWEGKNYGQPVQFGKTDEKVL